MDEFELVKKLIFEKHELPILSIMRMPLIDLGREFRIEKFEEILDFKDIFNELFGEKKW